MVWLVWIIYLYMFYVGVFGEEVCGDMQCIGIVWCLCGVGVFISDNCIVFIEQQFLGVVIKFRNIIDVQIVFSCFIFQQILFCFFDVGQNGCFIGFIFVNINFEVNFFRVVIGMKQIGQI